MKLTLKHKSRAIIASSLVALFFLLHYYVYLGVPFLRDGGYTTIPLLQSYTDSPVELQELVLCEQKHPTYLNPFQKIEYSYQVVEGETYSECNIVERAGSIFTSNMEPIQGDPKDYFDGESGNEGMFMRGNVSNDYANLTFFVVQYAIIAGFLFVILREEKRK